MKSRRGDYRHLQTTLKVERDQLFKTRRILDDEFLKLELTESLAVLKLILHTYERKSEGIDPKATEAEDCVNHQAFQSGATGDEAVQRVLRGGDGFK